jgi:hypothetical protein
MQRHSIELRQHQVELWQELERFSVLVLHRRFGKTVLAICKLVHDVQECELPMPRGHYFAPFLKQARSIAWDYLKIITSPVQGMQFNKSELTATFPSGARIQLHGADNPDTFRGQYSDSVVLDEVAQMSPRMWGEVIRPALADRQGNALFIGTPFGRMNLFYDLYERAENLDGWFRKRWTVEDTNIIPPAELEMLKAEMQHEEYEQEMMCSWSAQVRGAYWAEKLDIADREGRIGAVPYDESVRVSTCWDLGMNDSTAIWFWQMAGREIHLIDYQEYTGMGLPDIIRDLNSRPYIYDMHIGPHDLRVRELGTGASRLDTARNLGVSFTVARNIPVIDGISAVRDMLGRCWFDEVKCRAGIEALRLYRSEYDDKKRVLSLRPIHDWTSHASDAMRYLAVEISKGGRNIRGTEPNYDLLDRIA